MKLTKRHIDNVAYLGTAGSRDVRWDALLSGFGIRIYPNGKKAYVLSYRVDGRKRLITLGSASVLTLEQARDNARSLLVSVNGGNDPLAQRRKLAQGETVKELCVAYLEHYAKVHKKSWKEDERRIGRYLLPIWSNHKVATIKRADVATLHRTIGTNHPYEANRVLELISKLFSLARRWGFVEESAANPAKEIDHYKEHKRDRWVTHEELPKLMQAIGQDPNYYARAALWLYLLTGMRKSELLKARWDDINWERRELRLPDTKAGRVHYVPLSAAAISLLTKLLRVEGNPYLLPGNSDGKHLINIDKPWQRIRRAAGIPDVRLHDLRRTVGSWMAQAGNSLHLIGRVLNHSNPATTAVYARFGQDQVRQALEDHSQRIISIGGFLPGAEIVNIEG